jgi:hypothetical protein
VKFSIVDVDQNSPEWFAARAGRLTSSCADVIFMNGRSKGTESTTKRDLRIRLALERLTGRSLDGEGYRSADMEYGSKREPDARLAYQAHTGILLDTIGFLAVDGLLLGASPDAIVGSIDGGAEIKCPKPATHLAYLRTPGIPSDYLPQLRHQLLVTGAPWWDFVSFDDRMPDDLQLVVRRLWAKDADLAAHELAVRAFLTEVEREMEAIESLRRKVAA